MASLQAFAALAAATVTVAERINDLAQAGSRRASVPSLPPGAGRKPGKRELIGQSAAQRS
jgi:anaerobic nitric oxide reductase transcription regulator